MAANKNRDEFTPLTKRALEKQAGCKCSYPRCRRLTYAVSPDSEEELQIGEAAHICAASPGGPRYDMTMTRDERRSVDNGIWLCRTHARIIDVADAKFSVVLLHEWKQKTKKDAWESVMENIPYSTEQEPTLDELGEKLHEATFADLEIFRRTVRWPESRVMLTLKVNHIDGTLTTQELANAVTKLDDLILVAPPGMGKTTTLFQIAEGILESNVGSPIVVPLGNWATEGETIFNSILKRSAFRDFSEADLYTVASKPGVVLLLDGWNELDAGARIRAGVQIAGLKAELPELGFVISTRKQAFDVPLTGTRVNLLTLNEEQQI
jgi:hypothetical protein